MSEIVTYKNNKFQSFCQIKLDDGNRIMISVARTGVKVMKLKWAGMVSAGNIFEISIDDLFSDEYKEATIRLYERSQATELVDVFRDILLNCKTIDDVKEELQGIFNKPQTEDTENLATGEVLAIMFAEYFLRKQERAWLIEAFPNTSKEELVQEYIAFEIFIMIIALQSVYKDSPEGPHISKVFNMLIMDEFVKAGVLKDNLHYKVFVKPRLETYEESFKENKEPNYIYWISKQFCEFVGDVEISKMMMMSEHFVGALKANITLIRAIDNSHSNMD